LTGLNRDDGGMITESTPSLDTERRDLLETLAKHRMLFKQTVAGMTDDQARLQPTVSELCLGGLVKHVAQTESHWIDFILEGPTETGGFDEAAYAEHAKSFRLLEDETLAGALEAYDAVAARTTEVITSLPNLDVSQPLPEAPWFEPGARWSARRVVAHIIAETAQHAGHADIIRETIDGQKTMG
jgi:uncharacterized damage-inducible protein DinB